MISPADVAPPVASADAPGPLFNRGAWSELARRTMNVTLASLALVVLSPLMVLIALLVRVTSRGAAFYTQARVGLDRRQRRLNALYDRRTDDLGGRVFTIYKFRTMPVDAEAHSGPVWSSRSDPRVTWIGRILRRTRLDDLPQLFNVLHGDMNLVGPRPERPHIFARLRRDIAEYPLRQLARPGITGWAQVKQGSDKSVDDWTLDDVRTMVRYDLEYLRRQSLTEDLKIMVMAVPALLRRLRRAAGGGATR